jgi:class 3 adenylate cyclase
LASRLCHEAQGGQILISSLVRHEVHELVDLLEEGELVLKGFPRPIPAFSVMGLRQVAAG